MLGPHKPQCGEFGARWPHRTARHAEQCILELLEAEWASESLGQAGGRSQALRDCLSELPAKSRELLKMRYFDGQRCEEVAASLNTKLDAIYKRLSRLHQALKFCIETKLPQAPS